MRAFILDDDVVKRTSDVTEVVAAHAAGMTMWVDLEKRTADTDKLLAETFQLHPLSIEDVWADCELPKVEDFAEYLQIILHTIHQGKSPTQIRLSELDVIIGKNFVLTHANGEAGRPVAEELARSPRLLKKGPAWVAHAVIDTLVDAYMPLIDRFDDQISVLEAQVIEKAGTPAGRKVMSEIFALKRGLQHLRRNTIHQREILLRLSRGEFDEIPRDAMPFYRDVYDHFARVTDLADSYRELLSSALEAFLSVQSNRMNEIMKTLTLISTVMLPLTFIAGIYGMNFENMPELHWRFGYPFALTFMGLVGFAIVLWFRHKRWT